jgi:hypothetical protein
MNTEQARVYVLKAIEKEPKHKWYDRAVTWAEYYMRMITGEGQDVDLRQVVRRESPEDFKQRVSLTESITPAMTGGVIKTYEKTYRARPLIDKLDFEQGDKGEGFETKTEALQKVTDTFYGGDSIDHYLKTRVKDLSFSDPNAWIVVEFDPFDSATEKAKPRPVEYSSHSAIDYGYNRDRSLNYLFIKEKITLSKVAANGDTLTKEGTRYTLYFTDWAWVITELFEQPTSTSLSDQSGEVISNKANSKFYTLEKHFSGAGMVQAKRIGYVQDIFTQGETYVNPFHSGVPYLKKTIKAVSEMDLTQALHAHPQKVMYADRCKPDSSTGLCPSSGQKPHECSKCGGTARLVPTSAQEVILFDLPRKGDDVIDISKLVVYFHPDTEFLKFMGEWQEYLRTSFHRACFNSETFTQDTVEKTATAKNIDLQNVYDPLYDYAIQMAKIYMEIVRICAAFTDNDDGLIVNRVPPSDFGLKSFNQKLLDLQMANQSNAPGAVRTNLTGEVMKDIYRDDQVALKRYECKSRHHPFNGKTQEEILVIMAGNEVTVFTKTLYANYDPIFEELEMEAKEVWFYDMTYEKQKMLIKAKVDSIVAENKKNEPEIVLPKGDMQQ